MFGTLFNKVLQATSVAGFLIIGSLGATSVAQAQAPGFAPGCAPHKLVKKALKDHHKEVSGSFGVMKNAFILQVYVSEKGSWTMVRTDRAGTACIVASGHSWETVNLAQGKGV